MKYIKTYKLMMIAITISLVNAESLDGQIIRGKVIQVNEDVVQVEVINSDKIQTEDKVKIYYKTSHGSEMKIGEWKVTQVKPNSVVATPVDVYVPPKIGMISKVFPSSGKKKIAVGVDTTKNTETVVDDKNLQTRITSLVDKSQSYVDKAKKMADEFFINQKSYSKLHANDHWNEIILNLQKAISLGNGEAYYLLAMVYEDGYGNIQADMKKMIDNIIKSAEHGYVEAQYILGDMYEDGDEVIKDKNKAIYWYKKAVAQGHEEAQKVIR